MNEMGGWEGGQEMQRWDASVDHVISQEKENYPVSGIARHATSVEVGNLQKIFWLSHQTQELHSSDHFVYHPLSCLEKMAVDGVCWQGYHEHCRCLEMKKTGSFCKNRKILFFTSKRV